MFTYKFLSSLYIQFYIQNLHTNITYKFCSILHINFTFELYSKIVNDSWASKRGLININNRDYDDNLF